MKTKTRRSAALGGVVGSLALSLFGVPGTYAQDVLPVPVVDMSVTGVSNPTNVAPPGTPVVIEVHVGQGALPASGTLTVTLPVGFSYLDGSSTPSCSGSVLTPRTVTCPVAGNATGENFSVTATTPTTTGTYTTTLEVAPSAGIVETLEYSANNTSQVSTTVSQAETSTTGSGPAFSGVIQENGSATVSFTDGRRLTLFVPDGSTAGGGVIVTITGDNGATRVCEGTTPCGDGFSVVFDEVNPLFQATDPNNPLIATLTFGDQDPCRGLGSSKCTFVPWFTKDPADLTLEPVPFCPGSYPNGDSAGSGTMNPPNEDGTHDPCVNRRYKVSGPALTFDVLLLTIDPILDPPKNLRL